MSLCYKFPTESNTERILKIGKYLAKLWARVRCLVFFDSQCRFLLAVADSIHTAPRDITRKF